MAKKNTTQLARKALLRRGRALLRLRKQVEGNGPDFLAGMSKVERTEAEQIHAALERIERGVFGRCEECGCKIAGDRIEQLPHVRLCVACAQATLESEAVVDPAAPL